MQALACDKHHVGMVSVMKTMVKEEGMARPFKGMTVLDLPFKIFSWSFSIFLWSFRPKKAKESYLDFKGQAIFFFFLPFLWFYKIPSLELGSYLMKFFRFQVYNWRRL